MNSKDIYPSREIYLRCQEDFHGLDRVSEQIGSEWRKCLHEMVYFQTYIKSQDWKILNIERKISILQNQYLATLHDSAFFYHDFVKLVEQFNQGKPLFIKELLSEALDEYFDELKTLNMSSREFEKYHRAIKHIDHRNTETFRRRLKGIMDDLKKRWGIEKVEKLYTHRIFTE